MQRLLLDLISSSFNRESRTPSTLVPVACPGISRSGIETAGSHALSARRCVFLLHVFDGVHVLDHLHNRFLRHTCRLFSYSCPHSYFRPSAQQIADPLRFQLQTSSLTGPKTALTSLRINQEPQTWNRLRAYLSVNQVFRKFNFTAISGERNQRRLR